MQEVNEDGVNDWLTRRNPIAIGYKIIEVSKQPIEKIKVTKHNACNHVGNPISENEW